MFRAGEILPPDPDGLEVLHDREYRVRAFALSPERILIRGAVRDQKPPGVYLADDPEPLTMHHMQVDLTGPSHDLHSGLFGGTVANPANALSKILGSLIDDNGRVTIEGFYDDVLPLSDAGPRGGYGYMWWTERSGAGFPGVVLPAGSKLTTHTAAWGTLPSL